MGSIELQSLLFRGVWLVVVIIFGLNVCFFMCSKPRSYTLYVTVPAVVVCLVILRLFIPFSCNIRDQTTTDCVDVKRRGRS